MMPAGLPYELALALGLGLLGFVEPCSLGSTLVVLKQLEGRSRGQKLREAGGFALARAAVLGLLGAGAAFAGRAFFDFQRIAWLVLGAVYIGIGLVFLARRGAWLGQRLMPWSRRPASTVGLGAVFGLNVPACAAPLLLGLLGTEIAVGSGGAGVAAWRGFASLAVFGLALTAPLLAVLAWPRLERGLDWLCARTRYAPRLAGLLMLALGLGTVVFAWIHGLA